MKTANLAAVMIALLGIAALAQDKPEAAAKAPFEFNCTGDTVDNFKIAMVVNQKVDQSTARGTVEAYLGFTDGRDSTRKAHHVMGARWDEVALKELTPLEEKLLAPEARKAVEKARKEESAEGPDKNRVAPASEVTAETKAEDGTVLVETTQKITDKAPDKTGKMNERTREEKQRFTCVKAEDGKWRISKMDAWRSDYDPETQKSAWAWSDNSMMIGFYYAMADDRPAEPADLKQDTPENAALSLYNTLIARKEQLSHRAIVLMLTDWNKQMEALLSPELVTGAKKAMEEMSKAVRQVSKTASGTDAATEGKDGTKIVKIKKSSEWRPDVQVTLKQVEGKWMVVEAGTWENNGGIDTGPQYRVMADLYKLPSP